MSFDLTVLQQMEAYAKFGQAVIELAKELDIIPKRVKRQIIVREKTKIVTRRPRRTAAEIAEAAQGNEGRV